MLEPTEVGKVFGLLGILEAVLAILSKMSFGFMYKSTVSFLPELFLYVDSFICFVALIFAIFVHFGMKKVEN